MKGRGSQANAQESPAVNIDRGGFLALGSTTGYTIVEVMIFLAVSSLLFVMIALTFSGRQARTEFSVAAREMESRLLDIANDVSTGYYSKTADFTCAVGSDGAPVFTSTPQTQGTNKDCIFIGRAIQFDFQGDDMSYVVYSIAGARQTSSGEDVKEYSHANPRVIKNVTDGIDLSETIRLPVGLQFGYMRAAGTYMRGVAFYSTFGNQAATDSRGDSLSVDTVAIYATGNTKDQFESAIHDTAVLTWLRNPATGIQICFNSDGTDQHVVYTLGGNNARLTTDMTIEDGSC